MSEKKRTRRGRSSIKVNKKTDVIDYNEMYEYVDGLAQKAGYSTEFNEETGESEFDVVRYALIDFNNINRWSDADVSANYSDEDIVSVQQTYEEFMGNEELDDFEKSEVIKYVLRMDRYDRWIDPIQQDINALINDAEGALLGDTEFLNSLTEKVSTFGRSVFDRTDELNSELDELTKKYSEDNEAIVHQLKATQDKLAGTAEQTNELKKLLDKIKGIDGEDIGNAVGKTVSGAGGIIRGALTLFSRKKKEESAFDDEFEQINQIIEAMPQMKESMVGMKLELDDMVEEKLNPIEDAVDAIGRERAMTVRALRQWIAAAQEFDKRLTENVVPALEQASADAKTEADEETIYDNILREINQLQDKMVKRTEQLSSSQSMAKGMAGSLKNLKDGVETTRSKVDYYRNEVTKDMRSMMNIMTLSLEHLKQQKIIATFNDTISGMMDALSVTGELSERMEAKIGNTAARSEDVEEFIDNVSDTAAKRTARQLESTTEARKNTKRLLSKSDGAEAEAEKKAKALMGKSGAKRANDDTPSTTPKKGGGSDRFKKAADRIEADTGIDEEKIEVKPTEEEPKAKPKLDKPGA